MTASEITWLQTPNWSEAKKIWKWGWQLHVFGFASLYILVGLYTVFNIFTQRHFYLRKKKLHALFLNSMLLVSSFTRATVLLWNPYASESPSNIVLVLCVILLGVGSSCLTSAFSVVLLITLETTKLSLAPPRFQKPGFLIGILASSVIYNIISVVIVASYNSAKVMIFIRQVLLAIWGLVISVGYAVAAYKIRRNLGSSRKNSHYINRLSRESTKVHKLVILLCIASVEGFCLIILSIYMESGENGVFNDSGHVEIWPWFGLQTFPRFLELFTCGVIFLISLKSSGDHEEQDINNVEPNSMPLQTKIISTNRYT